MVLLCLKRDIPNSINLMLVVSTLGVVWYLAFVVGGGEGVKTLKSLLGHFSKSV